MEILGLIDIPVWLLILIVLCGLFYYYSVATFGTFEKIGVKGPKPLPLFGNIYEYMRKGFVETERQWFQKYGRFYGIYEGRHPLLMVGDADMLREITVKEFASFTNRRDLGLRNIIEKPASDFLTALTDDVWRHNRYTLTPVFSGGKLRKMSDFLNKAATSLVQAIKKGADKGEPLNVKQFTSAFTMQAIASSAFGLDIDTQNVKDDPFVKYARKFFEFSLFNPMLLMMFLFPSLVPLLSYLKVSFVPRDSVNFFRSIVNQALKERRQNPGKFNDFLQQMVTAEKQAETFSEKESNGGISNTSNGAKPNAGTINDQLGVAEDSRDTHWVDKRKGQGLTDSEILAASILFFTAGYDTTAATLSHALHHLTVNPDCQDRLIDEIDEFFPKGKIPTYENVNGLTYLEMVIMETLRINPPLGRMDRECNKEVVIKGIPIPVGMGIALPIYSIHHDPGYWPDPEVFDPERFSSENREKHHPLQWIPFGYGPRNCIGMRLALFEMKIALIHLFQNFRFIPNSKTVPLEFGNTIALTVNKHGVWATAVNRT